MRILVNGRAFREYSHQGMSFIEARHGSNYTVKIKNDNSYKVMAVLSVDGLDVITGKPAEDANKGYIIDAYSNVEIKGYRISDENSAAFIFSEKGKSYVAKGTGSARNSGVIGVRVFREKEKPASTTVWYQPIVYPTYVYPWNPWYSGGYTINALNTGGTVTVTNPGTSVYSVHSSGVSGDGVSTGTSFANGVSYNTTANCSGKIGATSGVSMRAQSLETPTAHASNAFDTPISYKQFDTGTAWGKKLDDKVKKEHFDRGVLVTELVVYYATKTALEKMGIDLVEDPRIAEHPAPQAFGTKYCVPPKGWQG